MKSEKTINFIEKANKVHNNFYDYTKTEYVKYNEKVVITCPIHGDFEQEPRKHLSGTRCKECFLDSRKLTTDEFINKARSIHGDRYDYSKVRYVNNKTDVYIICKEHGEFFQTPNKHLSGQGCPKCKGDNISKQLTRSVDEFIDLSNSIHKNKYIYDKTQYNNCKEKVCIICPEHGEFWQTPDAHISGQGCPKCGNVSSIAEDEITSIVSDLEPIRNDRNILSGKEIDIYVPSHKIGIEYNGLLWHTEFFGGKDKNYHINKVEECNKQGISLISVFEDEYTNNKDIVISKIKHIFGLNERKPTIYARKCVVKEIDNSLAKGFLNKNHIQGFATSSVYIGCFYNDLLVGVMTFKNLKNNNVDLNRCATDINFNCVGVCGKMFKYYIRNYEFNSIKSFADRRWTLNVNDNLYTKLGFSFDGYVKPSYTYYNKDIKYKRFHKFGFRKAKLIKLNDKFNSSMTELEMALSLGYDRIWDCGLIRYVYNKQ